MWPAICCRQRKSNHRDRHLRAQPALQPAAVCQGLYVAWPNLKVCKWHTKNYSSSGQVQQAARATRTYFVSLESTLQNRRGLVTRTPNSARQPLRCDYMALLDTETAGACQSLLPPDRLRFWLNEPYKKLRMHRCSDGGDVQNMPRQTSRPGE